MENTSKNFPNQHSCAHAWATGSYFAGHASNFFFVGSTIYSYGTHFPIATIYGHHVFFTTCSYSRSTAKHISIVASAVSHLHFVFVPIVPLLRVSPNEDIAFINENLAIWESELEQNLNLYIVNNRKKTLINKSLQLIQAISSFKEVLNCPIDASLQAMIDSQEVETMLEFVRERNKSADHQKRLELNKKMKAFTARLKRWKMGEIQHLINPLEPNLAYLRINQQAELVETSKGIYIPLTKAFDFYSYIKEVLSSRSSSAIHEYYFMESKVLEISNRQLIVGCHTIKMTEIKKIVRQLKW